MKTCKRPPSYFRYEKRHPTVSVRLSAELKGVLDEYREDMSYPQAIKKLLVHNKAAMESQNAIKEAQREERITIPCVICGRPIKVTETSHPTSLREIKQFTKRLRFKHQGCHY